ncbi:MAG: SGNH/GDSL hydrolase family protein [Planctomycetota bacterium]|jgi:lysophospholipase L1-like esterase
MMLKRLMLISILTVLSCLFSSCISNPDNSGFRHEPSDEKTLKAATDNAKPETYDPTDDATLSEEHLAWEIILKENLGSFYYPRYLKKRIAGEEQAWDYVKDDPSLPRILIIGDSISRGYTLPVRHALAGKVNVHRAPENCGATSRGLEKLDLWLGNGPWDLIVFNFGIHDRNTSSDVYRKNLETIIARLQLTNAKLLWVTTTPVPPGALEYVEGSIERLNPIGLEVALAHQIPVADLHTEVLPILEDYQYPQNCHFEDEGYEYMGQFIAQQVMRALAQ